MKALLAEEERDGKPGEPPNGFMCSVQSTPELATGRVVLFSVPGALIGHADTTRSHLPPTPVL